MIEKRAKRKLTAILTADVKGYSRLMGEDELATIDTLKKYRTLMAVIIQQFRGRVVDSPGDNLMAEFGSVVDAVESAIEIQKKLKEKNLPLPENRRMEFRIGINLGDIVEDGERIYGDGVNISARLEGFAEGGGICVSGTVYDHVKNKIPLGYRYLGKKTVKNITEPVRVYLIDMEPASTVHRAKRVSELVRKPSILTITVILAFGITIILFLLFHNAAPNPPIRTAGPSVVNEQSGLERTPQADGPRLPVSSGHTRVSGREDGASLHLIPGGGFFLPESWGTDHGSEVEIAPFYMDETPVTNQQYVEFLNQEISRVSVKRGVVREGTSIWVMLGDVLKGYEPILFERDRFRVKNPIHSSCPVVRVTAYGAAAYARFYGKRLPTAAEWLYVLVSGSGKKIKSPPVTQDATGKKSAATPLTSMMDIEELEMADEPSVKPSAKGRNHFPYPVMLYTSDKFGVRGLNANIAEWVMRRVSYPGTSESVVTYSVMGGIMDGLDQTDSLPTPLLRQPWEAFREVGFRCARNAVSLPK